MSGGEKRRQRAVRLTDEAVDLLMARLQKVARRNGTEVRLTRASRATLMGVSIGTAARILGQKGNDRTLLVHVFESLGLPWDDRYCEAKPLEGAGTQANLPEPEPEAKSEAVRPSPRHRLLTGVLVTLAIAGPFAGLIWVKITSGRIVTKSDPGPSVHTKLDAGRAAYLRGDYRLAEKFVKEAVELGKTASPPYKLADSLALEGDILAAQGRLEEAVDHYQKALPFWDVLGKAHGYASLLESLGIAEARLGRLSEAEGHFEEALKHREAVNDSGVEAGLLRDLGSVAAVRGDLAAARRKYQEASLAIVDRPEEAMHIDLRALKALLLRDEGKYDEALAELRECLKAWEARGHSRWVATTLFQIATVQTAAGHQDLAETAIQAAKRSFEEVGDARGAKECTKWLAGNRGGSDFTTRVEEYF